MNPVHSTLPNGREVLSAGSFGLPLRTFVGMVAHVPVVQLGFDVLWHADDVEAFSERHKKPELLRLRDTGAGWTTGVILSGAGDAFVIDIGSVVITVPADSAWVQETERGVRMARSKWIFDSAMEVLFILLILSLCAFVLFMLYNA